MNVVTKSAVSVSEMARMLSMSRARFYQLMGQGVFPQPQYELSTKRPFFDELAQQICLDVRRRNCGVNGRPVMFYAARTSPPIPTRPAKVKPQPNVKHVDLVESLACLGLVVTHQQVEAALKESYPTGVPDTDQGGVVRTLFLSLKRQELSR